MKRITIKPNGWKPGDPVVCNMPVGPVKEERFFVQTDTSTGVTMGTSSNSVFEASFWLGFAAGFVTGIILLSVVLIIR